MSQVEVLVHGTVNADGTLHVDEKVNLPPGRVQISVRQVAPAISPQEDVMDVLKRIWAGKKARGHVPRTKEETDAELDAMRDEWEQRQLEIERIQEEAHRPRESGGQSGEKTE
jgi:hypothetical protein